MFRPVSPDGYPLPPDTTADRKTCMRFGPCGLSKTAIYMGGRFTDRKYRIPLTAAERVYKRVAMSKGGFSGRGMFASIPYLVVEYGGGKELKCVFRREEQIDDLLIQLASQNPEIPRHSAEAERKLLEREHMREKKLQRHVPDAARDVIAELERAAEYLEKRSSLSDALSKASKRKRAYDISKPVYRHTAMFITLFGAAAAAYGIYAVISEGIGSFGLYFLLFGMAAIFFFSGMSALPTAANNRRRLDNALRDAENQMAEYTALYPGFPLPARYAHPVVLRMMEDIIANGRADSADDAMELLKQDLRSIDSSVRLERDEYEEVMAIKPMFLINEYR